MDLLNNPWIVGIGAGVLSGLVGAYLTRLIFSRRDTREYVQKTHQANHEVLYAVRPGISEGVIPTNDVLRSLIAATARKYGVEAKDMHDLEAVSSELVKEVMDSSFISAASKQEFCEKPAQVREDEPSESKVDAEYDYDVGARYRQQLVGVLGGVTGVLTAAGAVLLGFDKGSFSLSDPEILLAITLPAILVMVFSIIAVMAREMRRMRLDSLNLRLAGLRADFKRKTSDETEQS